MAALLGPLFRTVAAPLMEKAAPLFGKTAASTATTAATSTAPSLFSGKSMVGGALTGGAVTGMMGLLNSSKGSQAQGGQPSVEQSIASAVAPGSVSASAPAGVFGAPAAGQDGSTGGGGFLGKLLSPITSMFGL